MAQERDAAPPAASGSSQPSVNLVSDSQGAPTAGSHRARSGSNTQVPDEFRDEIVWQIFGDSVGAVLRDFSCAVESKILLHGRLYVTSSYVLFYSNIFGFEKIIKIPFSHVKSISKEKTALFIPNAISVITGKREYVFRSFWDREVAYRAVKNAHRATQGLPPLPTVDDDAAADKAATATTTTAGSAAGAAAGRNGSVDTSGSPGDSPNAERAEGAGGSEHDSELNEADSASDGGDEWVEGHDDHNNEYDENGGSSSYSSDNDSDTYAAGDQSHDSSSSAPATAASPRSAHQHHRRSSSNRGVASQDTFTAALQSLQDTSSTNAKGSVKKETVSAQLPCSVAVFFEQLLADDAPHGLVPFHTAQGDWDVSASPWSSSNSNSSSSSSSSSNAWQSRELRYVHPFTAPMGPQQTRTVKSQRCRQFSNEGLILQTTTHLEDIMMSDYFQIEDTCVVKPRGSDSIEVTVVIQIKFFKSTMMRRMIEQKSLSDSQEVWQKLLARTRQALEAPTAASSSAPPPAAGAAATDSSTNGGTASTEGTSRGESRSCRKSEDSSSSRKQLQRGSRKATKRRKTNSSSSSHSSSSGRRAVRVVYWLFVLVPWLLLALFAAWEVAGYRQLRAEMEGLRGSLQLALTHANTPAVESTATAAAAADTAGSSDAVSDPAQHSSSSKMDSSTADVAAESAVAATATALSDSVQQIVMDQCVGAYARACFTVVRFFIGDL